MLYSTKQETTVSVSEDGLELFELSVAPNGQVVIASGSYVLSNRKVISGFSFESLKRAIEEVERARGESL